MATNPTFISDFIRRISELTVPSDTFPPLTNRSKAQAITQQPGIVAYLIASTTAGLSANQLDIPADEGANARYDGMMFRFFNTDDSDSGFYWLVRDVTTSLFRIYGQEGYTMIWREADSDWVIIRGILR